MSDGQTARHGGLPPRRASVAIVAVAFIPAMMALTAGSVKAQVSPPRPPAASPPPPTPSAVGPRLPLSLAEAVFIGLRDNRTVKSAYISRVAEKYDLYVAKARFRPTALLAGEVDATRGTDQSGTTISVTPTATWLLPTGAEFQLSYSRFQEPINGMESGTTISTLTVTQPLLKGGGLAVNMAPIRIAELQERINRLALKSTVIDTVTSIIQAYRTLEEAQQQLVIAGQALDRSRAQLATNQALIDAGRMAAAELVQTQADIAGQQVSLIQAEQARNSAQLALLRLLAMDLHTNVVAADPITVAHVAIDLDRVIGMALDNRPDLLSAQRTLEQDRQSLIVAKNNRLWTLSAVGSVQHQSFSGGGLTIIDPVTQLPINLAGTSASVGLQLSIPLGDLSLAQEEVTATTTLRVQQTQLDDLKQAIEAEVRDSVQGVELTWRQVAAARDARDLAAKTLDLERQLLAAGRTSNFEVLTFEGNLRAADTQLLSAEIAYLNALTGLDQQLGTTLDTWRISLNS